MNPCQKCGIPTENPRFCTQSCAASFNNKIYPKRTVQPHNLCDSCGKRLRCSQNQRVSNKCRVCHDKERMTKYGMKTKKESVAESTSYAAKHKYEKIRQYGKRIANHFGWSTNVCEKCGYDKHAELCHVKPIADFPDSALVSEINSRENILFLCPNCHWELDNLVINPAQ